VEAQQAWATGLVAEQHEVLAEDPDVQGSPASRQLFG
jgi:hypothetical protein